MANSDRNYALTLAMDIILGLVPQKSVRRVLESASTENAPHPDFRPDLRRVSSLQSLPAKAPLGEGTNKLKTIQDARRALSDRSNVKRHLSHSKSENTATKEKSDYRSVEVIQDTTTLYKDAPAVSDAPPLSSLSRRSDLSRRALRDITRDHQNDKDNTKNETKDDTKKSLSENDKDTTEASAKEEEEKDPLLEHFYEDNKTRYQDKEEKILPVPVLPIKVPDHMRPLFMSRQAIAAKAQDRRHSDQSLTGIKRKLEAAQEPIRRVEHKKSELSLLPKETNTRHPPAPRDHIDTFFADKKADPTAIGEKIEESALAGHTPESITPLLKERVFERLDSMPDIAALRADLVNEDVYKAAYAFDKEQELRAVQARTQATRNLSMFDFNDPMMVAEYADDIFTYLHEAEMNTMADPLYATNQQHEITWKTRGVLIDWVIEIHYRFGLLPETLFLAVNIIDRFLSRRTVALGKLQLVGVTSLFIATKFEEMASPLLSEFIGMTNGFVEEDELLKAERFILQVLDFKLCFANPLNFFRRAAMAEDYELHTRMLAKYFMEISCVDHRFIGIRPSQISSASLWLAQKMVAKNEWHERPVHFTGYKMNDLKPTVELMLDYLSQPVKHDIFYHKWATRKLLRASIFVRDWINRYYLK